MKLKQAIKESGMSLNEISKLTDIKYRTLRAYESEYRNLTVKAAKALGKVLDVNWYAFFEEEKEESECQN